MRTLGVAAVLMLAMAFSGCGGSGKQTSAPNADADVSSASQSESTSPTPEPVKEMSDRDLCLLLSEAPTRGLSAKPGDFETFSQALGDAAATGGGARAWVSDLLDASDEMRRVIAEDDILALVDAEGHWDQAFLDYRGACKSLGLPTKR